MKNLFDMYGYSPYLFIGGYQRNGSFLGLLSTLLSIIVGGLFSLSFIIEFIYKKKITIITSETNPEGIDSYKLTKNTSFFSFYLQDPFSYVPILDESIYYPKVYYKTAKRNNKEGFIWTQKSLEFGRCELKYFNENFQDLFINYDLKNMYCVKNLNEYIKGIFTKDEYSFIFVEFYECKNTTEKFNCKSENEINYYLNGTFIAINFQDTTIEPNNYLNPMIPKVGEFYTTLSKNYFKEIHLYFKKILIETDKGLVFNDRDYKEYVQYDHNEDMLSFKYPENGNFLEFSIKFADKITHFSRSYTKAQTVISNIGGFVKFIQTSFWILSYIFIENTVFQEIINKIFYFDESFMEKKKMVDLKKLRRRSVFDKNNNYSGTTKNLLNLNIKSNRIFYNKDKKSFHSSSNVILNIDEKIKKEILHNTNNNITRKNKFKTFLNSSENSFFIAESKKINLNYCQRFCLKFSNQKKSNIIMLYQKGIGLIHQKLDVISIIKDSFQLAIIKTMFFNNEHILLLDNIIKTELSSEKYDKNLTSLNNVQKVNNEVKNAYNLIVNRYQNNINNQNKRSAELNNLDFYFVQLLNEQFSQD